MTELDTPDTGLRRRRKLLVAIVVTAVLAAAAGAGAATVLKSPAQVAAETAPPAPDTLTAAVERRVVVDTLITRGKAVSTSAAGVQGTAPAGVEGARPVVTKVKVSSGESLEPGRQLFEVSGRPVFTLSGPLPAYRDLRTGATGEDVAQLQHALATLGRSSAPDRSGTFGPGTERAVTALYKSLGYQPVRMPNASGRSDTPKTADSPAPPASAAPAVPTAGTASAPAAPTADAVVVPMAEVVYLSALPARAESVTATVGQAPGDRLMTVSTGDLMIDALVSGDEKARLKPGQRTEILDEATGTRTGGSVLSVSDSVVKPKDEQTGSGAPGYQLRIKPDHALGPDLAGKDVRLTITSASSEVPVLTVPSAAVSSGADGRSSVGVLEADGTVRRVVVRPGLSGDGFLGVTAEDGASLAPGQRVVVGTKPAGGRP
ncbi:Peptidoglycan binding domain-containing protein [Kitasatospora sp. MMS16-BH015]|uniref:peptidoglycan-binding domain-containing protein n=1 Tax=Kitasatospora sp. MMS16-BH015 TaxID=2018025 RepID=UPI000CA29CAC|nr:peptidoglycan-binding domain-containing protein [Kitasatospora sp. MMS16-BH015]AUG78591.1 Peptidoglycan binding domain-containing protein [Kitasatospora sp. MMS16-BH015]